MHSLDLITEALHTFCLCNYTFLWSPLSLPLLSLSCSAPSPLHRNSPHHSCKAALNDLLNSVCWVMKDTLCHKTPVLSWMEFRAQEDGLANGYWPHSITPPTRATGISCLMNSMLMRSSGSHLLPGRAQVRWTRIHDAECCGDGQEAENSRLKRFSLRLDGKNWCEWKMKYDIDSLFVSSNTADAAAGLSASLWKWRINYSMLN